MKSLIILALTLFGILSMVESIYKGTDATSHTYPYSPKLVTTMRINRKLREITCTGTLMTSKLIVTTAKCLRAKNPAKTSVKVTLSDGSFTTYTPTALIPNPKYNVSTLENNIGVVVIPPVSTSIITGSQISLLPSLNDESGFVDLFGWGRPTSISPSSDKLLYGAFSLINNSDCTIAPMSPTSVKLPRPSDICTARPLHGYVNALCFDDEGVGLLFLTSSLLYSLLGVYSFTAGSGNCEDNSNAVYERVESHYDWLKNLTNAYP